MIEKSGQPNESNRYLEQHVQRMLVSYFHWTQRHLIEPGLTPLEQALRLFDAPFAALSHNTDADPLLNYANRTCLQLFEIDWEEMIALPSRRTAEPLHREERARLLATVSRQGFIDDYSGVRISKRGRRFMIDRATVWNLLDEHGVPYGQAATFINWRYL